MTTDIAVPTSTLAERKEYSQVIAQSDLLPPQFKGKPQNVLLALDIAQSLGRTAIEVMQQAQVISGKLTLSAEFMRSLVLGSGHILRVFMDGDVAVAQGIRKDDPTFTHEARWDMARAKAAGLGSGDNWKKHPSAMLKARATTELCRDAFADVIHGVRSTEEAIDIPPEHSAASRVQAAVNAKVSAPAPTIVDADPEPVDVSDATVLASDAQLRAMHAGFGDLGITDRDERLDFCSGVLGRDVDTSKDLTADEAARVLDRIAAERAK